MSDPRPGDQRAPRTPTEAAAELRLYRALAQAALERGAERQLMAWTVAKSAAAAGCFGRGGRREGVPSDRFVKVVAETAGRSPSTLRKILRAGEGTFWVTDHQRRLFLPGPDQLARRLGIDDAGGRMHRVEVSGRIGVAEWRALLLATMLPFQPRRLSREFIASTTSISVRTQRRWERNGVAVHDDGRGRLPIRSQRVFGSFNLALPVHPELGRLTPRAALAEESRDGRPLGSAGFFTDRDGKQLLRHGPK